MEEDVAASKSGRLRDLNDVYAAGILGLSVQQPLGVIEGCSLSYLVCCLEQNYLET